MKMKTDDAIVLRVAKMLDDRSRVGNLKYENPLMKDNRTLHEWCTMAQEELLDGANYLEKIKSICEGVDKFNLSVAYLEQEQETCCGCRNRCKDCTDECEPCRCDE